MSAKERIEEIWEQTQYALGRLRHYPNDLLPEMREQVAKIIEGATDLITRLTEERDGLKEKLDETEKERAFWEREDELSRKTFDELLEQNKALTEERDELRGLLNSPEIADFMKAVPLEAAHQVFRWGEDHDKNKHAHDWAATLVYLIGKAMQANWDEDTDRLKHHTIAMAATCANWHKQIGTKS
jgi:hypothetical protein